MVGFAFFHKSRVASNLTYELNSILILIFKVDIL